MRLCALKVNGLCLARRWRVAVDLVPGGHAVCRNGQSPRGGNVERLRVDFRTASVHSPAAHRLLPNAQIRRGFHRSAACTVDFRTSYESAFRKSVEEPEEFWSECAQGISWFKPWQKTLEFSNPPFARWFVDGEINVCYNALDRHVENGLGDQIAIIHDSPVTDTKEIITYKEALEKVSRLAAVLVQHGVKKGDRIAIYMPMIPQAIYTMLACARIGAIHSLIFGGFASKELSTRINHAKPKLIVTSSFGIEPGRRVEYIPLLEKALNSAQHKPDKVIIYNRPNMERVHLTSGHELDWDEELSAAQPHDCVPVSSDHPLYILYTSGTTGLPKGIVRTSGGYAVMLNWTMSKVYGLKPGEVWWAASDLGWVVGHSYICYGPLLHGNTTVLYEGKPVGTPNAGAYFRLLAEHGVVSMFTAPTALRAIRQQDFETKHGRSYQFPRFRTLFVAGEHCDASTLEWAKQVFRVPVLDHWWQTETGSPISASCVGLGNSLNPPIGQAGKPVPGYNADIKLAFKRLLYSNITAILQAICFPSKRRCRCWTGIDKGKNHTTPGYGPTICLEVQAFGALLLCQAASCLMKKQHSESLYFQVMILDKNLKEMNPNSLGNIVVKLPLPPGTLATLWGNDKLFKELYFTKYPGYYDTMDAGYMDNNGYLYVMSRVDDVINVAGHRISAGSVEEAIITHQAVTDCAVVALEDSVKGHVPLALCVLRTGVTETFEDLTEEIVKIVRDSIGPVAALRKVVFVPVLPKTRSGKIPRSTLSAVANGKPYQITPTIEDPSVFSEIEAILKQRKISS